jgi:glycosyltransferase involved in cell wall biosynthesis
MKQSADHCLPLISCIMPTSNRRQFVPRAIEYFLRQDYPRKEIIILDDGSDPVADLIPSSSQIRYERLRRKVPLGRKRNLACEAARGELILHWDDDDWMAPRRISHQVETLLQANAEIAGQRRLLFLEVTSGISWLYEYPVGGRIWFAGGSLLYTRDLWKRTRFPELQVGEDTHFIWNCGTLRSAVVDSLELYVAMVHPGNTSPKHHHSSYWCRWDGDVKALLATDWLYYETLNRKESNMTSTPLRLNLGCCDAPLSGFVNVDVVPGPSVDQVADLRQSWPWSDNSVDYVRAFDVIEHLPDKIHTMNELWRVLHHGGRAEIAVPTTEGSGAFQDPTHVSFWNRRSFLYYEAGNPYRERFAQHYEIYAKFRIVQERTDPSVDGPRLTITLEAVKP